MQKYEVAILPTAESVIRGIIDYISSVYENEPAAYSHALGIYEVIGSLDMFPYRFQVYEGHPSGIYRVARSRQYRIFYYIDEEDKTVYVVDIMHSHRDLNSLSLQL